MPRERLKLGTYGSISFSTTAAGAVMASTWFRDYDGQRRRIRAQGTSQYTAESNLKEKLRERETPLEFSELKPTSEVQALASVWLSQFKEQSDRANTVSRYSETLNAHILPRMSKLVLAECTPNIITYHLKKIGADHGYSSAKVAKTVLSNMFTLAVDNNALQMNPVKNAHLPKRTTPKKEIDVLTLDEAQRVVQACQGDIRAVVQMMLGTGCRIGEVLALRWKDLDLTPGRSKVTISGTALPARKGVPAQRQELAKTSDSMRDVFIPEELASILRDRAQNHIPAHAKTTLWATPEAYVFPATNGNVWEQNNFRSKFRNQVKDAELGRSISPHIFRKTVATMVSREDSLTVASQLLGHSSEKITEDYYIQKLTQTPNASAVLGAYFV